MRTSLLRWHVSLRQQCNMLGGSERHSIRANFVHDFQRQVDAARQLRADLEMHEVISQRIVASVEEDRQPLGKALQATKSSQWRTSLSTSIRNFEHLRRQARLSLIVLGLDEGMTTQDLARELGVTRQLMQRYLKEIERLDRVSSPEGSREPADSPDESTST